MMGDLAHGVYSSDKVAVFKFILRMKIRDEKSILSPTVVERISFRPAVVDSVLSLVFVRRINSQQLLFIDVSVV